jgi:hypothetical protein
MTALHLPGGELYGFDRTRAISNLPANIWTRDAESRPDAVSAVFRLPVDGLF